MQVSTPECKVCSKLRLTGLTAITQETDAMSPLYNWCWRQWIHAQ